MHDRCSVNLCLRLRLRLRLRLLRPFFERFFERLLSSYFRSNLAGGIAVCCSEWDCPEQVAALPVWRL